MARRQGRQGLFISLSAAVLQTNVGISDGLDAVHSDIDWNFAKFLVARDGTVVKRFHSHGQCCCSCGTRGLSSSMMALITSNC